MLATKLPLPMNVHDQQWNDRTQVAVDIKVINFEAPDIVIPIDIICARWRFHLE